MNIFLIIILILIFISCVATPGKSQIDETNEKLQRIIDLFEKINKKEN